MKAASCLAHTSKNGCPLVWMKHSSRLTSSADRDRGCTSIFLIACSHTLSITERLPS